MVVACLLHGWQSSGRRVATGSRCWPRSEPAAGAGCVALPDRRFVTYSLCAIPAIFHGSGPGEACQTQTVPRPGGTCQFPFVPLPGLGHAHYAEPAGGKRPGGTCQSVSPSLSRFGPGQPGHSSWGVRPTGAVARASLGRRGCGRQSVSRQGLRVGRDGSRVAARGRRPSGHGLGALHALSACFVFGPRPRGSARGRRRAGSRPRAPSSPVCGPASLFGFYCRPPFSIPLYTHSCSFTFNAADSLGEAQEFRGLLSSALPRPPFPRNP